MSEVWIYLDVDGVLNAVSRKTHAWGWGDGEAMVTLKGFGIRWATELVEAINELAAEPHVRMHWLTTWEDEAPNLLSAAIGINGRNWPVLRRQGHHEPTPHAWWKLNAIREHLPHGQRAIWIDDDIAFDEATAVWLQANPNVVPVCPRTELGITRRQMRLITDAAVTQTPAIRQASAEHHKRDVPEVAEVETQHETSEESADA